MNFQKFSDPLEPFLFLNLLQINFAAKKLQKNVEIWCPFLKRISDYASDMKYFRKAYLRPFPRLDVSRFCIYSTVVNIQPNSK